MLEEGGDYWKNGKAGKKMAKKRKKEMITSSLEKGSIQPECSSNIMFNIFVNLTLRQKSKHTYVDNKSQDTRSVQMKTQIPPTKNWMALIIGKLQQKKE